MKYVVDSSFIIFLLRKKRLDKLLSYEELYCPKGVIDELTRKWYKYSVKEILVLIKTKKLVVLDVKNPKLYKGLSKTDCEVIELAKRLKAKVLTKDKGIIKILEGFKRNNAAAGIRTRA